MRKFEYDIMGVEYTAVVTENEVIVTNNEKMVIMNLSKLYRIEIADITELFRNGEITTNELTEYLDNIANNTDEQLENMILYHIVNQM
jgi:hypothetical protein